MDEAYMGVCDVNLILNMDATTFAVYGDGLVVKVAVVRNKLDKAPVTTHTEDNSLGIYVKVYNAISMGLSAAPLVLVLADDTMAADEFSCFQVSRLTHDCGATSYGWIVLCKTRACNDNFYIWYFKEILVSITKLGTSSLRSISLEPMESARGVAERKCQVGGWELSRIGGWELSRIGGWEQPRIGGWELSRIGGWEQPRIGGWEQSRIGGWEQARRVRK